MSGISAAKQIITAESDVTDQRNGQAQGQRFVLIGAQRMLHFLPVQFVHQHEQQCCNRSKKYQREDMFCPSPVRVFIALRQLEKFVRLFPGHNGLSSISVSENLPAQAEAHERETIDRKSTRLNSSHVKISYAVFCLKK